MDIKADDNSVDARVGARIRAIRRWRGVTQVRLAEALGLSFQQVQKYETGDSRMVASKLWEAARFLNVSVGDFFHETEETVTETDELLDAWFAIGVSERRQAMLALIRSLADPKP